MPSPYLAEFLNYLKGAYPPFVLAKKPRQVCGYTPVFIFHSVQNEEFENKLIYLKQNNYKTITVSELYLSLKGNVTIKDPSVCLTFDDGHVSLYETAYPLLKKYSFNATAFIVPSFIGNPRWINWIQAKEMSDSGVLDVQSHTLTHKRIFVSDRITGRNNPGLFKNELGLDKPTIFQNSRETKDIPENYPIYEMDSRMSDKMRYVENNRWETVEEQVNDILFELAESKKMIENKINKQVLHLAYPWGIGSELSQTLSREAGFLTNFFGVLHKTPYNTKDTDPYALARLKDDYIFRLPGAGRWPLINIFMEKFMRRKKAGTKGKDIY